MREIDYSKLSKLPTGKGGRVGEAHQNATITEDTVREIRRLHDVEGYGSPRIARAVGMSIAQVSRIIRRIAWSHVK